MLLQPAAFIFLEAFSPISGLFRDLGVSDLYFERDLLYDKAFCIFMQQDLTKLFSLALYTCPSLYIVDNIWSAQATLEGILPKVEVSIPSKVIDFVFLSKTASSSKSFTLLTRALFSYSDINKRLSASSFCFLRSLISSSRGLSLRYYSWRKS